MPPPCRSAMARHRGSPRPRPRRGYGLRMQIAVKEMLHLPRPKFAAGIRHAEQQLAAAFFQFHRDRAAGRRKFQRIGQQMIQELLHGAGVNRADAALHGADEFQVDPQHLRQIAGAFADLANQLYQICVPQRGRLRCSQIFSGGKAVHQPQQPVKALIQHAALASSTDPVPALPPE